MTALYLRSPSVDGMKPVKLFISHFGFSPNFSVGFQKTKWQAVVNSDWRLELLSSVFDWLIIRITGILSSNHMYFTCDTISLIASSCEKFFPAVKGECGKDEGLF